MKADSQTYEKLYFEPSFAVGQKTGGTSLLKKGDLGTYRMYRKAHDINRYLLGQKGSRDVMNTIYDMRRGLKKESYSDMNSFVVTPSKVAANAKMQEGDVANILSVLSERMVGVLEIEAAGQYSLTKMGVACLDDMTYRRNRSELKKMGIL